METEEASLTLAGKAFPAAKAGLRGALKDLTVKSYQNMGVLQDFLLDGDLEKYQKSK